MSLFGQTNQQSSLFGNNSSKGGSLFGNQSANNGGGLFSGTTQNQSSLFGNQNSNLLNQPKTGGQGLFGAPQGQSTSLFNNNQPSSGLFSNTSTFPAGNQVSAFSNPGVTQLNHYPTKRDIDIQEIAILFNNFIDAYNPSSPSNLFKYFLYTRGDITCDIRQLQQYSPYIKTEDGTNNCIDFNLWRKATQDNKNPQRTFPTQISSPKQFEFRIKKEEINLLCVLEEIVKTQKNLEALNLKYENDMNEELIEARNKMKKIKHLLTMVSTKMAKFSLRIGKGEKNMTAEKKISEQLNSIRNLLQEDSEFKRKVNNVKNISLEHTFVENDENNYMKEMNKMRIDKSMNALRELKCVIDTQFSNLNKNIKIINGIQNDINQLNSYGNLK